MLHTEPSFCIYNTNDGEIIGNKALEGKLLVEKDGIAALGSPKFSFGKNAMVIEEDGNEKEGKEETLSAIKDLGIEGVAVCSPWPRAGGIGSDGDGGGLDSGSSRFDENGDLEEYYKRMITEDPSNSFLLRYYAQFLQSKGKFSEAGDCYYRATLAAPKDGEVLLHHILVAYASFLWELDEEEEESSSSNEQLQVEEFGVQTDHSHSEFAEDKRPGSPPLHLATGLGIDMAGFGGTIGHAHCMTADSSNSNNVEEYYRRMIEENPSNPLFVRNYVQYLCETRGDLQAAEEYYLQAIHSDPSNGEITLQYANLIWELRHDRHEALPYFKQAVQAAPQNSNVLAAYARFVWETEEDEEEDNVQVPQGTTANA